MSDRLAELALLYRDAALDGPELDELQAMLRRDGAMRDQFVELLYHGRLIHRMHTPQRAVIDPEPPRPQSEPKRRIIGTIGVAAGLAAAVMLALTHWVMQPNAEQSEPQTRGPRTSHVALLTDTRKAVFAERHAPVKLGDALEAGPIDLVPGHAQLMFESGAVVDLTGPCQFSMTGPNRGRLSAGSLAAFVPEKARGFTVDLPDGIEVVDLGTRFTTSTQPRIGSMIEIAEGRVEVRRGEHVQPLEAGQSLWIARAADRWLPDVHQITAQPLTGVRVAGALRSVAPPAAPAVWAVVPRAIEPVIYEEASGVRLTSDLAVTLRPAGPSSQTAGQILNRHDTLPAGTVVRSYMLYYKAPPGEPDAVQTASGSVTFDAPILGIVTTTDQLQQNAPLLDAADAQPLWQTPMTPFEGSDTIAFADGQHTLNFTCRALPGGADYLRIIVAHQPERDKP